MNLKRWKKHQYDVSVIVIFFNMQREARRTLWSLTKEYQRITDGFSYEIIAVDNGSTEPLDSHYVEKNFGGNIRYIYFNASNPSPCEALNYGAQIARGNLITLCIDGARILSPGILNYSMLASKMFNNPFIYTLGMHIGHKPQNYLANEGYSQAEEDKLISSIDWEKNGYSLFDISSLALSSRKGYLANITESNCLTMRKSTYEKIGGYDEGFKSAGGGLTNLDFFNRVNQVKDIDPVLLLGEATFHQFHGGTATNVPMKEHPWKKMEDEYISLKGKPYQPYSRSPVYFGMIHPKVHRLFCNFTENDL